MGLLLDLDPDGGLDDSGGNEEELEAELLALMGGGGSGGPAGRKPGGKGEDTKQYVDMTTNSYNQLSFSHHLSLFFASCRFRSHGGH